MNHSLKKLVIIRYTIYSIKNTNIGVTIYEKLRFLIKKG